MIPHHCSDNTKLEPILTGGTERKKLHNHCEPKEYLCTSSFGAKNVFITGVDGTLKIDVTGIRRKASKDERQASLKDILDAAAAKLDADQVRKCFSSFPPAPDNAYSKRNAQIGLANLFGSFRFAIPTQSELVSLGY